LQERGIDLAAGVSLQTDVHGDVRVASDHPQREAIERLFHDDAELRNLFVRIDRQASALRAGDRAAEPSRLQVETPGDASARIQQLLDASPPTRFSLTVRPHEMFVQFL
jgi:hypothetical protein